jgi:hypothetical protein
MSSLKDNSSDCEGRVRRFYPVHPVTYAEFHPCRFSTRESESLKSGLRRGVTCCRIMVLLPTTKSSSCRPRGVSSRNDPAVHDGRDMNARGTRNEWMSSAVGAGEITGKKIVSGLWTVRGEFIVFAFSAFGIWRAWQHKASVRRSHCTSLYIIGTLRQMLLLQRRR